MTGGLNYTLAKALKHHKAGKYTKARPLYQKVLKADPDNVGALHMLGLLLHQCGNSDKALTMFQRVLELGSPSSGLYTNLGKLLYSTGRLEEAIAAFEAAIALDPRLALAHEELGTARYQLGERDRAVECYQEAVRLDPGSVAALTNLGKLALESDDTSQAIGYFHRVLEIDADNAIVRHLLTAIQGEETGTAPVEYITRLFDDTAENFDKVLVDDLRYIVPEGLKHAIDREQPADNKALDIIDLGCGTGLCGPLFRDRARTLVGIDLSPRMLDKARARQVYDKLITDDLVSGLKNTRKSWDIVLAADVFVYIGDLDATFHTVATSLSPGGLFGYSVETGNEETDYQLQPTGRFAHSLSYLRRLGLQAGLEEVYLKQTAIRHEHDRPIDGYIMVLRGPSLDKREKE